MSRIVIGEILKPQGIKGEVKVKMKEEEFFSNLSFVYLKNEKTAVNRVVVRGGYAYVMFDGCNDRNKAELLRGFKLKVDREDLPTFNEDEYLIEDLIGLTVIDEQEYEIGQVKDILQFGATDIVVTGGKFGKWQFPLIKDIVVKVDLARKRLIVDRKHFEEVKCEY